MIKNVPVINLSRKKYHGYAKESDLVSDYLIQPGLGIVRTTDSLRSARIEHERHSFDG